MAELFSTFFSTGILGSVIILVILLMRPLLCKAPRNILCILWILVAVRLLVPFQLESRLSLQPQYAPQSESVTSVTKVTTSTVAPNTKPIPTLSVETEQGELTTPDVSSTPNVSPAPMPVEPNVQPKPEPIPDSTESMPQQVPAISNSSSNHLQTIAAIWLGVALSLLLYAVAAYCILKCKLREAVKCADGALETSTINGAFLLGYFKPEIYLPEGLKEQDRTFILSHEQAHIKRGDNWWKLLGLLCVCIHWYNPLVWVSYTLLCRDIEIACDEQVIQSMQLDDRKAYSLALLNSGKRISGLFVYPVAFGEISLKQRIQNVLSYRKPGLWITAIAIVVAAVISVCFMTSPKTDSPKESEKDTTPTSSQTETNTSAESDPTISEPTEPEPTDPEPTGPEPADPEPADPEPTDPEPTDPEPTDPEPTDPEPTDPEPTDPKPTTPVKPPVTEPDPTDRITVIAEGTVDHGPTTWKITSDGVLTISGNRLQQNSYTNLWKNYSDIVAKIIIGDGITRIYNHAFSEMYNVTEVYLSNTLTHMEEGAFEQCTSLRSVTIPASLKVIPQYAFHGCINLTELNFAPNCQLETIEEYAFYNSGIVSFISPPSLRLIDFNAFRECKSLKTVILQGGVEQVNKDAFKNCTSLKHLVLGESINHITVPFEGCYAIETLEINVTNGTGDFKDRTALKSVVIGGKMTVVWGGMFSGCTSLCNVTITSPVTRIELDAFANCKSLYSITLPDTVTEIQRRAFSGSGLTEIIIPASVTDIGSSVFMDCTLNKVVFCGDIPQMTNNNTFSSAVATAYYPADNPTWTEDKLKNYGGTVTWIPR